MLNGFLFRWIALTLLKGTATEAAIQHLGFLLEQHVTEPLARLCRSAAAFVFKLARKLWILALWIAVVLIFFRVIDTIPQWVLGLLAIWFILWHLGKLQSRQ